MILELTEIRPDQRLRVVNRSAGGSVLVRRLRLAVSWGARLRGLLWSEPLRGGEGILLYPCNGVHSFFMKYAIDVVFIDEQARIVELRRALAPWRLTAIHAEAAAVLELQAGAALSRETTVGDQLVFQQY